MSTLRTTNIQHGGAGAINNIVLDNQGNVFFASGVTVSGDLTVNEDYTVSGDLTIGGNTLLENSTNQQLTLRREDGSAAADVGGGMSFQYLQTGSATRDLASINGLKEETADNSAGYLEFQTAADGANPETKARITSSGTLILTGTNQLNYGTFTASGTNSRIAVCGGFTGSPGGIDVIRGNNTPSVSNNLGLVNFKLNSPGDNYATVAQIRAARAGSGNWATGDHPTSLVFQTTAPGADDIDGASGGLGLTLTPKGALSVSCRVGCDYTNQAITNTLDHLLSRCQTQCQRISAISNTNSGVFDIGPLQSGDYRYRITVIGAHNNTQGTRVAGLYLAAVRQSNDAFRVDEIYFSSSNASITVTFADVGNVLRMTIANGTGTALRQTQVLVESFANNSNAQYVAMDSTLGSASPGLGT